MDTAAYPEGPSYGLRREVLSPVQTLAQSVSTIAPTTTPVATIPLVCALAGNGTWLVYVVATCAILLVALCVAKFARYCSSPGSLYTYTLKTLPPTPAATVAWSLLLAYICTGASVAGGFYHYGNLLLHDATGRGASVVLLTLLVTAVSAWIAWRDVKISTRLMLWIEGISVSLILIVVLLVLARTRSFLDIQQLRLHGATGSGLRLGLVLALFSFVGFESATTLGAEARNPLRTIPRAVLQSAVLVGVIFTLCAYTEVLGLRAAGQDLARSQAPMRVLATVGGIPILGLLIDVGALVSLFAGTLGCVTAAARVLLLMAHNGLAPTSLGVAHQHNETPGRASIVAGVAVGLPVAVLAARGASGLDVYGWMGSLATYGFIVTYALVCLALPTYLRSRGECRPGARIIPWIACIAMLLGLAGNLYPVPQGPYGKLPYVYFGYLVAGMSWFFWRTRRRKPALAEG